MSKPPCLEAFEKALSLRQSHPLACGAYKLMEAASRMSESINEVNKIKTLITGRATQCTLKHYTMDDKHMWLQALPEHIAHRLGYEILPGLRALIHDGALPLAVNNLYPTIKRRCDKLLERLEQTSLIVCADIEAEYPPCGMVAHCSSLCFPRPSASLYTHWQHLTSSHRIDSEMPVMQPAHGVLGETYHSTRSPRAH